MAKRYPSRWIIMAACLMLMSLSGTVYAFGVISDSIKDRLNLSQTEIDIVALMGGIGQYTYIVGGICVNQYGPFKSIWLGIILTVCGWALLTFMTTQRIHTSSAYVVGTANFIYNQGNAWMGCVAAPTIVQNFPSEDHGKLLGLAKAYLGISAAWISIWKRDLANDHIDFFMFAVLLSLPVLSCVFAMFMRHLPQSIAATYTEREMGSIATCCSTNSVPATAPNFNFWYANLLILAIYLVVTAIIQDVYDLNLVIRLTLFVVMLILWLFPWVFAIFCHGPMSVTQVEDSCNYNIQTSKEMGTVSTCRELQVGMPTILGRLEFWILYIIFGVVAGSGLTFINNVSQIVESASEKSKDAEDKNTNITTTLVTIISVGNVSGRLFMGIVSDKYKHKYHRVNWSILAAVIMCAANIYLFVIGTELNLLFPGSFLIGFAYGSMICIGIMSSNDLFGSKYLSGNYAALDTSLMIGSTIFATFVFGSIYGYRGKTQQHDGNKCFGADCYKWSFLICSVACFVATILAYLLSKRLESGRNSNIAQKRPILIQNDFK